MAAAGFVVRKISLGLCEVALGKRQLLELGDLSVVRDFSHARDHAKALVMLALTAPAGDYVVASGEGHSISEVVDVACEHLHLDRSRVVRSAESLRRAADPPSLVGDASKLRALGWQPAVDFRTLITMIVDHDFSLLQGRAETAS